MATKMTVSPPTSIKGHGFTWFGWDVVVEVVGNPTKDFYIGDQVLICWCDDLGSKVALNLRTRKVFRLDDNDNVLFDYSERTIIIKDER